MQEELVQCVEYFKSRPQYKRIMQCILKNYQSYGGPAGNVIIKDASYEECMAATEIVSPRRPYAPPLLKFKLSDFEKGIAETRFGNLNLQQIIETYFNTEIVSSRDRKNSEDEQKRNFWEKMISDSENSCCQDWFKEMYHSQNYGYRSVMTEYRTSRKNAEKLMGYLKEAIDICSVISYPVQLAVLSARVTGNPHFFDKSNPAGRLLLQGISYISGINLTGLSETEKEIYSAFNIEPDTVSGAAAAIGLRLFDSEHNEHPGYKYFADKGEVCLVSVSGLSNIEYADCDRKTVYIVENPMVFSALSDTAAECGACLVCTFGQIKYSGLRIIDMLAGSGCRIRYSGDFDPEGIQIADRLVLRNKNIRPWRMSPEDYNSIEKSETINEKRLKMLENISDSELKNTAGLILCSKKSAYQELLTETLRKDILSEKNNH